MPTVNYNNKTVSDEDLKAVLQKVADKMSSDVNVISGDRSYVPKGGSSTSLHLAKRAADIHVSGKTDQCVYATLKEKKSDIFTADKKYEVIHHGFHTATGGSHVHIGRYATGTGVKFKVEGLTKATKGTYSPD